MASLTNSEVQAIRHLADKGTASRPEIGESLAVSRPTTSATIASLEDRGIVEATGRTVGASGRRSVIYRLAHRLGIILAVDGGSSVLRARAVTLDGTVHYEAVHEGEFYRSRVSEAMWRAVHQLILEVASKLCADEKVLSIGVALPMRGLNGVPVDQQPGIQEFSTLRDLGQTLSCPVLLENNVNCAALGELRRGAARHKKDFVYLQFGNKIGMGLVINGQLIRGAHGAAGEIGHLPFPWGPGQSPVVEELEHYTSVPTLMRRTKAMWRHDDGISPNTPQQLVEAFRAGRPSAIEHLHEYARHLGYIAATTVCVVNPELVVLGGQLALEELLPVLSTSLGNVTQQTPVVIGALHQDATIIGVSKIALDHAVDRLIGGTISRD